jgi:hypothetical protein
MTSSTDKTLSMIEAARLLYRAKSPTPAQVGHVQKLVKAGTLRAVNNRGAPSQWTTSESAIADFLAHQSAERQSAEQAAHTGDSMLAPSLAKSPADAVRLQALYQGLWRDYFLAVLLRRRATHRSAAFQHAVLAGQVLLLLLLVGAMVLGVGLTATFDSPEQVAIERYLAENNDHYTIVRWHDPEPAEGGGTIVRVEYSYRKESVRPVVTDRRFLVQGDSVTEIFEASE